MAKVDTDAVVKYAGLGAGAAAATAIAGKATFLAGILSSQIMAFDLMGVTVGGIVLAGLGIGLVDQFFFSK